MKVAVLSLVRDRPEYTSHCFRLLRSFAGCEYDHFVLDQGSTEQAGGGALLGLSAYVALKHNIGISRGMNVLLEIIDGEDYDVVVKFDNDCELMQPDTLKTICELVLQSGALLSPRILGLQNPPQPTGTFRVPLSTDSGTPMKAYTIQDIPQIGGIFLAAPASVYDDFRFNPDNPIFGGDDVEICHWWRANGGRCGYVERFTANHYETTAGQQERYPSYFERKFSEMSLCS